MRLPGRLSPHAIETGLARSLWDWTGTQYIAKQLHPTAFSDIDPVESLRRYHAMGFDHVMVRHIVGDHRLMLRSFERIGHDVMPRIRAF